MRRIWRYKSLKDLGRRKNARALLGNSPLNRPVKTLSATEHPRYVVPSTPYELRDFEQSTTDIRFTKMFPTLSTVHLSPNLWGSPPRSQACQDSDDDYQTLRNLLQYPDSTNSLSINRHLCRSHSLNPNLLSLKS
jgi:hypothetical protein